MKALKGLTIIQNIFLENTCEVAVRASYCVELVIIDPLAPASVGCCVCVCLFQSSCTPFSFSLIQEKGKLIDSNSLNSVIYSFTACKDKLKEHLSANAARSLLCQCRYFVE